MRLERRLLSGTLLLAACFWPIGASGTPAGTSLPHDYPITAVPFTAVEFSDGFWSRRIDVNRNVTLWHNFRKCETTGRIDNFVFAAGLKKGKYQGYQFNDSDLFKAIEGASYTLLVRRDRGLERYLDSVITFIAAAQEADGYLYTPRRLIREDYAPPGGKERWVGIKDGSHELYNLGHLYEAAAAHYRATGARNLLDVALKSAELVCSTFGPGRRGEVPGHQEIEIGLCKLYRVTGDERYLRMAKWFLDQRGNAQGHELMGEYAQDHLPILAQESAVGHSVRAAYMYSGMADVAALTGDSSYVRALDRLWRDVINTKLYVTGGIGASGGNEGFSHPYALPNLSAYCETCASIALALWSERMFLLHGDAQYIDVLERTLYNSLLSGVAMSGDLFFYPNPLQSFHGAPRSPWFGCACCPPNVLRFISSVGSSVYALRGADLYVNLYAAGSGSIETPNGTVGIRQETRYPWEGTIQLQIEPERPAAFTLHLRIPGWAQNRPVPGSLYHYLDTAQGLIALAVNGVPTAVTAEKGYALVQRTWKKGDVVTLSLPMAVHRIAAHDSLLEDRGRVALQRGPVVYCLEGVDVTGGWVTDIVLGDSVDLSYAYRADILNGVGTLEGVGLSAQRTLEGGIVSSGAKHFTAIPYYAWAHRGKSQMTVWLARSLEATSPVPAPTLAYRSRASASGDISARAVQDQLEPRNSSDESVPYVHWWPKKGTTEWIQYDFPEAHTVSHVEVYFFDDTGTGECRIPKSWRILYKEGDTWKSVANATDYRCEKDHPATVSFAPVRTEAIRLELVLQSEFSAGIFEWKVE